jgi:hypothetical protein
VQTSELEEKNKLMGKDNQPKTEKTINQNDLHTPFRNDQITIN